MSAYVRVNAGTAAAVAVAAVSRMRISVANINIMFISSVNGFCVCMLNFVRVRCCTRFMRVCVDF